MTPRITLSLLCVFIVALVFTSCTGQRPAMDDSLAKMLKIIPLTAKHTSAEMRFENETLQKKEVEWGDSGSPAKDRYEAFSRCIFRRKFITLDIPQVSHAVSFTTTMGVLDESGVIEVRFNKNIDISDFTSSLCMRGFMQVAGKKEILASSMDVSEAKEDFDADKRVKISLSFSGKISDAIEKALKREKALSVYMDGRLSGQVSHSGKGAQGKHIYSFSRKRLIMEPAIGDSETLITGALLYSGPLSQPLLLEGPFIRENQSP